MGNKKILLGFQIAQWVHGLASGKIFISLHLERCY